MFLHRVLPPPASNALVSPTNLHHATNHRRDSIQDNRIMTHERALGFSQPTEKSASPESPLSNTIHDRKPVPLTAKDSTPYQSDGNDASRHRPRAVSDNYQESGSSGRSTNPVGVQDSTENLRSAVSPSQVCLCQPDPKVPRPRNGE